MPLDFPLSGSPPCTTDVEDMIHLYVDGELAFDLQPLLFAHLATCEDCRRVFESVLYFRQAIRLEHLPVPPAADDAFFKRLAKHRRRDRRVDRVADRRPLWQRRAPVSLGVAVVVAIVVFGAGLLLQMPPSKPVYVEGMQERVELPDLPLTEQVYVVWPGLTVEAEKYAPVIEPL